MLFWAAAVVVAFKIMHRPLFDYDLWWHLAHGRLMVEEHIFPRQELFSHTLPGLPWVNFEWLSQVLLYIAVKMGGILALFYVKILIGLFIIGLLVVLVKQHGALPPYLAGLVVLGFLTLRPRLYERVELASLVLMPIFVAGISAFRSLPFFLARKISWALAGLMVLWCNLHGGFVYGIGAAVLLAAGARFSGEPTHIVALYDRTIVLLLAAIFITPFGIRLPEIFIEHAMQFSDGKVLIEEWLPTTLNSNPFFWLLFLATALAALFGTKSRSMRFWGLALVVFALWGTRHQRNAAYFVFFALPFLSERFSKFSSEIISRSAVQTCAWVVATLLLGVMTIYAARRPVSEVLAGYRVPAGACEFIQTNGVKGRLYNTYHLGGYIEWSLGREHPVFMDGRYLFHPLLVQQLQLDEALAQTLDDTPWKKLFEKTSVDHAIVDYSAPMFSSQGRTPFPLAWQNLVFPRSDWALVYWDDAAMVFLKRVPTFAPLIQKYEYHALWPYNLEQMNSMVKAGVIPMAKLRSELKRHSSEVATSAIRQSISNRFTEGE